MSYDILIIDDEKDIRDQISGILEDEGFEARVGSNSFEAFEQIRKRRPHLIILDVWLGNEQDGLHVLQKVKEHHYDIPVIMISGHATISTAVQAIKNGAYDFIEKPFQVDKLLITIQRAIETSHLKRENAHLKILEEKNVNLIGNSSIADFLREKVQKASSNHWRVFISGSTGSGKELLAKEIHDNSARKKNPFIVINCAHIHPNELEKELFGFEMINKENKKDVAKIGLVEKAHQGTLFFHQISAIPLPIQGKIVQLLTEDKFSRVGSTDRVRVNIRYMASSTENIEGLIKNGDFREDLFYRLNVFNIQIPKLCERFQDFEEMIDTLAEQYAKKHGTPKKVFSSEAINVLQTHTWPGNIAEFKSFIDWVLTSFQSREEKIIEKDDLPYDLLQDKNSTLRKFDSSDMVILPIKEAREIFEKDYLQTQILRFSGNISQTARFIGMERAALHRKLKLLGLNTTEYKNEEGDTL